MDERDAERSALGYRVRSALLEALLALYSFRPPLRVFQSIRTAHLHDDSDSTRTLVLLPLRLDKVSPDRRSNHDGRSRKAEDEAQIGMEV